MLPLVLQASPDTAPQLFEVPKSYQLEVQGPVAHI